MDKAKKMKALAAMLAKKKSDDSSENAKNRRSNSFVDVNDPEANMKRYGKMKAEPFKMAGMNKAQINRMAQVKKKGK